MPAFFLAFVDQMLPGLRFYIQKLIGYTFTGWVHEKKAFFCYGPIGNNGKTTLFQVLREILGKDYCAMLPIEVLMVQGQQSNNTLAAMADLRGARFAWTSETDEGQRLSESQLKRLTQGMGAPIQAARKFEHPITFPETHKLWAECNHRPDVRGTDNATWERIHLIPFDVTLTADEIDRELPAKLAQESEGILAWGVAGAVKWFQEGLSTPDAVSAAGGEWREDSDQIGRFIADCCVVGDFAQARGARLYQSYHKWAEDSGERRIASNNEFASAIAKRGFTKDRDSAGVFYRGIGLRTSQSAPERET
jgi:putative DNA primase/helicase